jgi:protein TonB
VTDQWLIFSFGASLAIHLTLLPLLSPFFQAGPARPIAVPVELVELPPLAPPPSAQTSKPKVQKITAPKLLSKPAIFEAPPLPTAGHIKERTEDSEKPIEALPPLAALPLELGSVKEGWNPGAKPGATEGSAAGAGNLFGKGDVGVVSGSTLEGGAGGRSSSGLGGGTGGDGSGGGGAGSGEAISAVARPLVGYQVKPRYPESARRAGVQGVTLLKLHILENGRVSQVVVEQSAGHPDLDSAAADAVRRWLFEPARIGKRPVAVWALLPVKFQLD